LRLIERVFNVLYMRTASEDLTTRARIRDTAIGVFGSQGFTAGVRSIATAAGVSPGLLNHHFGSKDGLRTACDEHVLRVIRESKAASSAPAGMMEQLARIDEYAPLVAYIVRSFAAGGTLARELFEHMVDDAVRYIEDGVRDGRFTPSRDPAARARFLTRQNVGGPPRPDDAEIPTESAVQPRQMPRAPLLCTRVLTIGQHMNPIQTNPNFDWYRIEIVPRG